MQEEITKLCDQPTIFTSKSTKAIQILHASQPFATSKNWKLITTNSL